MSNILSIIYSCVGIKKFYFSDQGCYELTKTPEKNPEKKPEIFLETKEVEKSVPVTAATNVSTVDGWVMQFVALYCTYFQ